MENVQPPPTRSRSASTITSSNSMSATDVLTDGVGIAKALSALDAARETRKRKRGALQDISNKKVLPPTLASSKAGGSAVVKKPVVSTSSISVVTTTTRARGATTSTAATSKVSARATGSKSSAASASSATAAAASKRTSAAALKKLDAVTKRRKPDGDEPHVPHKVQTSMLSFQTSSSLASTASARSSDASGLKTSASSTVLLKKVRSSASTLPLNHALVQSVDSLAMRRLCARSSLQAAQWFVQRAKRTAAAALPPARRTGHSRRRASTHRVRTRSRSTTEVRAFASYMLLRGVEYMAHSRPCDETGSGFDERTYAALVRDIDARAAPQATAPCAKLARELDAYYRQHEAKYQPEATYMGTFQTDINEKMRTILVDWLIEVGEEYDLDSQTFHKAVCLCSA